MKKLGKVLGILGGLFVFSEVFGITGEVQALVAVSGIYPDEIDDVLERIDDDEFVKDCSKYGKFKIKTVGRITRMVLDFFDNMCLL